MLKRLSLLVIPFLLLGVILAWVLAARLDLFGDTTLTDVAGLIRSWGWWAPVASILLMSLQALVAPIPAFLVAAANGLVFGYWGIAVSWIGAMIGAALAFGVARSFTDHVARRMFGRERFWNYVDRVSSRHGFRVVIVARLLPFVSFDVVSYAAGLSTMRLAPFLLATGAGMIPGTVLYTMVGGQARNLDRYSQAVLVGSVALAGVMLVYWVVAAIVRQRRS